MKLEQLRESYQYYSGKASEIVRQLAFAGIAVIWVFKTNSGDRQVVPPELFGAGILLVCALALDLLHYVVGTLIWGIYNRITERKLYASSAGESSNAVERGKRLNKIGLIAEEKDFTVSPKLNWPTLILFGSKIIVTFAAYILLLRFLMQNVT